MEPEANWREAGGEAVQLAEAQHELKSVYESLRNRTRELAEAQAREAAAKVAIIEAWTYVQDYEQITKRQVRRYLDHIHDALLETPPPDLVAMVKALRTLWKRADAEGQDCDFAMEALSSPLAQAALRQLEGA